jgi:hypothetical protein
MVSWSSNYLRIISSRDVIDDLESHRFSLAELLPCPYDLKSQIDRSLDINGVEYYRELMLRYGASCESEWNLSRWGVQWDIESLEMARRDDRKKKYPNSTIEARFKTAYAGPVQAVRNLRERYYFGSIDIKFEYLIPDKRTAGFLHYDDDRGWRKGKIKYRKALDLVEWADRNSVSQIIKDVEV